MCTFSSHKCRIPGAGETASICRGYLRGCVHRLPQRQPIWPTAWFTVNMCFHSQCITLHSYTNVRAAFCSQCITLHSYTNVRAAFYSQCITLHSYTNVCAGFCGQCITLHSYTNVCAGFHSQCITLHSYINVYAGFTANAQPCIAFHVYAADQAWWPN